MDKITYHDESGNIVFEVTTDGDTMHVDRCKLADDYNIDWHHYAIHSNFDKKYWVGMKRKDIGCHCWYKISRETGEIVEKSPTHTSIQYPNISTDYNWLYKLCQHGHYIVGWILYDKESLPQIWDVVGIKQQKGDNYMTIGVRGHSYEGFEDNEDEFVSRCTELSLKFINPLP